MAKAEAGEPDARMLLRSLYDYLKTVDQSVANGVYPACVGCDIELHQGEMAGFGVLMPEAKNGIGLVTSFCEACTKKGPDSMACKVIDGIENETGAELTYMQ